MDSNFINNISPRLRRFAVNIEIKETLVDKIWEIFDDPKNVHDYQFLRDKRLIMTHNGDVKIGSWEILPGNRLLIERGNESPINLLYDFSTLGIIFMKKAGKNQTPFLLFDKDVIPDGNIIRYLEEREKANTHIPPIYIKEETDNLHPIAILFAIIMLAFFLLLIIMTIGSGSKQSS
jgi:hypothetical protein